MGGGTNPRKSRPPKVGALRYKGGLKLAIVGSTEIDWSPEVQRIILDAVARLKPGLVISGGAPGVDTIAEWLARDQEIPREIYEPSVWRWEGRGGFKERNQQIADRCDHLIRIVWEKSKTYGSGWTRDRAREQGKPTEEYIIRNFVPVRDRTNGRRGVEMRGDKLAGEHREDKAPEPLTRAGRSNSHPYDPDRREDGQQGKRQSVSIDGGRQGFDAPSSRPAD